MTTDSSTSPADDRAARLEALRRRRATSKTDEMATVPQPAGVPARPSKQRARRRHAAAGTRILAGGLSVATALGLMGAMAGGLGNAGTDSTASAPVATRPASAAPIVVILRRSASTQPADVVAPQIPAAPRVTRAVAAPVTVSRRS